jgi:hypothetical protein
MSKESVIVVDIGVLRVATRGQRVELALMIWNANRALQMALTVEQGETVLEALATSCDEARAAGIEAAAASERRAQEEARSA